MIKELLTKISVLSRGVLKERQKRADLEAISQEREKKIKTLEANIYNKVIIIN